jgi:hypothetical protein
MKIWGGFYQTARMSFSHLTLTMESDDEKLSAWKTAVVVDWPSAVLATNSLVRNADFTTPEENQSHCSDLPFLVVVFL